MASDYTKVSPDKLRDFTMRAFEKVGVGKEDAATAADILLVTDLRGIDSHGVARLAASYIKGLRDGRVNPRPKIQVSSQAPATAIMDGDRGLGFVVGHRAMTEAIQRAKAVGAGFVTVKNSTHFGAGGNYSMMALEHDMIGMSMTIGGKGMVVPGSVGRGLGINVFGMSFPTGHGAPFVLDMATTVIAAGKVEIAGREGKTMPVGWAIDKNGEPITDPRKFYEEGAGLLPLGGLPVTGGYKGFGLSLMVDTLCRVLSGAAETDQMAGNHFFGAIRIDGFQPVAEFKKSMDASAERLRSLPRAPGVQRIYVPGEVEYEVEKQRRAEGIPLHASVLASLRQMAQEIGMDYDL
jgi:L-2-hydroxycarboxylate dehydrogenase (NAD+)